ncbi:MAG TPA: hypothetical protein VGF55_20260 [Gemmataceae bacterium]|jgi:hypothetical protein
MPAALTLTGPQVRRLPPDVTARRLRLRDCPALEELPDGLAVRHLEIANCPRLTRLPRGLRCYEVQARGSNLTELPPDLRVDFRLDLQDSKRLTHLPAGLTVGSLNLRGCDALERLPEGLTVSFLDLTGCARLTDWPRRVSVRCGDLVLTGCTGLTRLPAGLEVARLDLRDCANVRDLPPDLRVTTGIDVAGSGLATRFAGTPLPPALRGVPLWWRGVPVSERVAFRPETVAAGEVLAEGNAERRRVMLERVGFERFTAEAGAAVLDADRDPGGERRLLRVPLPGDEDLVCVAVVCPSTGRQYVLRVPPATRTCRQAAAWLAGFDDPDEYQPVVET